ncbi:dnaJ homolog subfamily C member 9-like [Erinaceus europaeus]|uniref:DnaJ homolog subfamily C member 9-like n=1 Tax=Erinaceus europaeus TaxID=9365 RepID=A0ABM3WS68_ERIEU|nr:dnaJ homolog subfamily C member 9-like [Erinaceus europaeus]
MASRACIVECRRLSLLHITTASQHPPGPGAIAPPMWYPSWDEAGTDGKGTTGLLELCEPVFGTADPYQVLGVRREATEASDGQVRRGYHKVSQQVHPDQVGEGDGDEEDAARSFQILGKVYSALSDREQRAGHDEQGLVDEESDVLNQDRDWETYWRLLFKKTTLQDIQAVEKTYKGSEEELPDSQQAYLDFEGDMDQRMESVLCVEYTDEPRIRSIIQQATDDGQVPSYKAFAKESKQKVNARKRRACVPATEVQKGTSDPRVAGTKCCPGHSLHSVCAQRGPQGTQSAAHPVQGPGQLSLPAAGQQDEQPGTMGSGGPGV